MFCWDEKKNQQLISERGISFEEIVEILENKNNVIKVVENKNYKDQYKMLVLIKGYVWSIPFEVREKTYWLITAWQDRKANKLFKEGKL